VVSLSVKGGFVTLNQKEKDLGFFFPTRFLDFNLIFEAQTMIFCVLKREKRGFR